MRAEKDKTIKCPICGSLSFGEDDDYENCDVCGWENDPYQRRHPDETGANNRWTVNSAKRAWEEGRSIKSYCPNPNGKS